MTNMSFPPDAVAETVTKIAEILKKRHETISVSEAACGGLLSAYLVSVPGASDWFHGGALVYSLKSRLKLSGWSEEDIMNYTGPSEKVALRLARNMRIEHGSTYVISETGIAGPINNSPEQKSVFHNEDVGTVYLGISSPKGEKSKVHKTGLVDRATNMQEFAQYGLEFFLEELSKIDGESLNEVDTDDHRAKKKRATDA